MLNLGAGVQSSVVLLMSIRGILPKLDAAVFANTQWEPRDVYAHLEWLEGEAKAAGIPIYRVTAGNLREHVTVGVKKKTKEGKHYVSLPIFVVNADGSRGLVSQRQCTNDYKIVPIERKARELLGLKRGQRWPKEPVLNQWFGISADEARRVRTPKRSAIEYSYPLVFDLGMSRDDCETWAAKHYPGHKFPRSACIGCPFHQNEEWQRIKADDEAWKDACEADVMIRSQTDGPRTGTCYLHRSCVPLADADLSVKPKGPDSLSLFRHECMGVCGV